MTTIYDAERVDVVQATNTAIESDCFECTCQGCVWDG